MKWTTAPSAARPALPSLQAGPVRRGSETNAPSTARPMAAVSARASVHSVGTTRAAFLARPSPSPWTQSTLSASPANSTAHRSSSGAAIGPSASSSAQARSAGRSRAGWGIGDSRMESIWRMDTGHGHLGTSRCRGPRHELLIEQTGCHAARRHWKRHFPRFRRPRLQASP
jgi:hypothetical protein